MGSCQEELYSRATSNKTSIETYTFTQGQLCWIVMKKYFRRFQYEQKFILLFFGKSYPLI